MAVEDNAFHHRANVLLAVSLLLGGEIDLADRQVELGRLVFPKDPNLIFLQALIGALRNDQDVVEDRLTELRKSNGEKYAEPAELICRSIADIHGNGPYPSATAFLGEVLPLRLGTHGKLRLPFQLPPRTREFLGSMAQGYWAYRFGGTELALEHFSRAAEIIPIATPLTWRANLLLETQQYEEACLAADEAIEAPSLIPETRRMRIEAGIVIWVHAAPRVEGRLVTREKAKARAFSCSPSMPKWVQRPHSWVKLQTVCSATRPIE